MKLNTRVLALSLAFGAVAAANAQNVTFSYVYLGGNAAIEALNGLSAGMELPSTLLVAPGSSSFKMGVKASNNTATDARYGAGGLMLCFDSATTGNSNYASQAAAVAAGVHKKANMSNLKYAGESGSGLADVAKVDNGGNDAGTGGITSLNKNYSGSNTATATTFKPIGIWSAHNFGTGLNLSLIAGGSAILASMDVDLSMANGDTYGDDAGETGLMIYGRQGAPTRHTYLGATSGTGQNTSSKIYKVQAVPEPATMLALGGALAAFARRRRK